MGKTEISWTDKSWNPIRGCSRVSEGCRHCYAETMAARFSDEGQPYYQLAKRTSSGPKWTGKVSFIHKHLLDPVRWQKPVRVFTNSMSDVFHEELSHEDIAAIFAVMAVAKRHTFQVLTKRSERMKDWFKWAGRLSMPELLGYARAKLKDHPEDLKTFDRADAEMGAYTWPLPNVWIGVSVENQEAADKRIPDLLATPAVIRFLSCEPLIGSVSLMDWLFDPTGNFRTHKGKRQFENVAKAGHGLHWVIAGCESGPGMRPCEHQWLRTLREECKAAGVKYFLKQATAAQEGGHRLYPSGQAARAEVVDVVKAGEGSKTKPGGVIERPYLDGFTHQEFPA